MDMSSVPYRMCPQPRRIGRPSWDSLHAVSVWVCAKVEMAVVRGTHRREAAVRWAAEAREAMATGAAATVAAGLLETGFQQAEGATATANEGAEAAVRRASARVSVMGWDWVPSPAAAAISGRPLGAA